MTNLTDTLRDLAIGESHAIMRRAKLRNYDIDDVRDELLKMNRVVGAIATRVGGLTVERLQQVNAAGTHLIYGLIVTRESAS